MLKLEEAKKLFNSYANSSQIISESIRCSHLVVEAFNKDGINHNKVASKLGCDIYELSLNIINTRYWKSITDNGNIILGVLDTHKVCAHISEAYQYTEQLGKIGLITYNNKEINELLGFPEECIYPELRKMVKSEKLN